jgi:hypothetical protein
MREGRVTHGPALGGPATLEAYPDFLIRQGFVG